MASDASQAPATAPSRAPSGAPAASGDEVWTIRRVLTWTQKRFAQAGFTSPRLDAELLLSHATGHNRVALYTHFEAPLEAAVLATFRELVRQRLAAQPVAYLTGQREFYGLALKVTPAVLIPRPETEGLVEAALSLLPGAASPSPVVETEVQAEPAELDEAPTLSAAEPGVELRYELDPEPTAEEPEPEAATLRKRKSTAEPAVPSGAVLLDVGTGSGAVALAVKHERPDVRVVAVDASAEALAVATENAQRLGLEIELLRSNLLSAVAELRCEVIAANLPYIPSAEIPTLQAEVRSEPHQALDGGPDGLRLVERLIAQAPKHLKPGGAIVLEIGSGQAPAVEALLAQHGYVEIASLRDLAGIARIVKGRRPG